MFFGSTRPWLFIATAWVALSACKSYNLNEPLHYEVTSRLAERADPTMFLDAAKHTAVRLGTRFVNSADQTHNPTIELDYDDHCADDVIAHVDNDENRIKFCRHAIDRQDLLDTVLHETAHALGVHGHVACDGDNVMCAHGAYTAKIIEQGELSYTQVDREKICTATAGGFCDVEVSTSSRQIDH